MHQAQREVWGPQGPAWSSGPCRLAVPPLAGSLSGPRQVHCPALAGSLFLPWSARCPALGRLAVPSDTGGGPSKHAMSAVGGATPRQRISNCLKEGIMEVFPEAMVGFIVTTGTLRSP